MLQQKLELKILGLISEQTDANTKNGGFFDFIELRKTKDPVWLTVSVFCFLGYWKLVFEIVDSIFTISIIII